MAIVGGGNPQQTHILNERGLGHIVVIDGLAPVEPRVAQIPVTLRAHIIIIHLRIHGHGPSNRAIIVRAHQLAADEILHGTQQILGLLVGLGLQAVQLQLGQTLHATLQQRIVQLLDGYHAQIRRQLVHQTIRFHFHFLLAGCLSAQRRFALRRELQKDATSHIPNRAHTLRGHIEYTQRSLLVVCRLIRWRGHRPAVATNRCKQQQH